MNASNSNSVVGETIDSADAQSRFLSAAELENLKSFVQDGERRVLAVHTISTSVDEIVRETMKNCFPLGHSDELRTPHQYSACVRDLKILLRYVSYSVLSADKNVFDEHLLPGLVEAYTALNISLNSTVRAISTMRYMTALIAGEETSQIVSEYFDYLCVQIQTQSAHCVQSSASDSSSDWHSWEPRSSLEWLENDSLTQQILCSKADPFGLETSAKSFFNSLVEMPYKFRRTVWREREIMAALYSHMDIWETIPGFTSISVARRTVDGKGGLVGILSFVDGTHIDEISLDDRLPAVISVESSISDFEGCVDVPIILELSDVYVPTTTQTDLSEGILHSRDTSVITTVELQSGKKLAGKGKKGTYGSRFTLAALVLSKGYSSTQRPELLTVRHGLLGYADVSLCESGSHIEIGRIDDNTEDISRQRYSEQLDIALVKTNSEHEYFFNPELNWIDQYPKKPIPILSAMPVQMFGGISGHQIGIVDQSMIIHPGPNPSITPYFSATISSQPGDSGALLVVGHDSKMASPKHIEEYMSDDWDGMSYSMQGILLAASVKNIPSTKAVFRPMITVLDWLNVIPYFPEREMDTCR